MSKKEQSIIIYTSPVAGSTCILLTIYTNTVLLNLYIPDSIHCMLFQKFCRHEIITTTTTTKPKIDQHKGNVSEMSSCFSSNSAFKLHHSSFNLSVLCNGRVTKYVWLPRHHLSPSSFSSSVFPQVCISHSGFTIFREIFCILYIKFYMWLLLIQPQR